MSATLEMTATWEAPGPGSWTRDPSHGSGAPTPWFRRIVTEHTAPTYRGVMAERGGAIDTLDMQFVNGDVYRRMVPLIGAARDNGKLPPKPVLWLVTRVHPAFRSRNRIAATSLRDKPYLDVIDDWEQERLEWMDTNRRFSAVDPTELGDTELADHLDRLDAHAVRGWIRHHQLHSSDLGPIGDLLLHARQWGLDPVHVMALLKGASPATTDAANHGKLIAEALRAADVDPAAVTDIAEVRAVAPAAELLDAFLDEFGWRVVSGYDIADLTLHELPRAICSLIAGAGTSPDHERAGSYSRTLEVERELRTQATDPAMFDTLLADARRAYGMRDDNGPLTWEWPTGLMRRAYLAAGLRLAGGGRIDDAALVFEMDQPELSAVLRGESVPTDLASRAAHRRWESTQTGPPTLGPQPDGEPDLSAFPPALGRLMGIVAIAAGMLEPDPVVERIELTGLGIGDESYTGVARVASDPVALMEEMEPGDVLVTAWTAPSYNAVLSIAGAVVVQEGGLLSHAAVMARELGIPAVIGCHRAMEAISSGDRIEVDPAAGCVRILD